MSLGSDPFSTIFNERGALLAIFGAMGGAVRSATLKTTWREGIRVIFIGSVLSFGFGSLSPYFLRPFIGKLPDDLATSLGFLCSAAFVVGLVGVTVAERIIAGDLTGKKATSDDQSD